MRDAGSRPFASRIETGATRRWTTPRAPGRRGALVLDRLQTRRSVKAAAIYGAVLVASLALFLAIPGIDLFVSGLFYDPQHGFWLAAWPPMHAVNASIRWLTWVSC